MLAERDAVWTADWIRSIKRKQRLNRGLTAWMLKDNSGVFIYIYIFYCQKFLWKDQNQQRLSLCTLWHSPPCPLILTEDESLKTGHRHVLYFEKNSWSLSFIANFTQTGVNREFIEDLFIIIYCLLFIFSCEFIHIWCSSSFQPFASWPFKYEQFVRA